MDYARPKPPSAAFDSAVAGFSYGAWELAQLMGWPVFRMKAPDRTTESIEHV